MDEYAQVGDILVWPQIAKVVNMIGDSKEIEMLDKLPDGRLSHIVISGTTTPIGYLGDDLLEKVNPKDESLRKYHNILEKIYEEATKK